MDFLVYCNECFDFEERVAVKTVVILVCDVSWTDKK